MDRIRLKPPEFPAIKKQRKSSLIFKIKLKQKKQEKTTGCKTEEEEGRSSGASEERHLIPCGECKKLFSSLKALFGHFRVHRKARRIATKPSTAAPPLPKRQKMNEELMAAETLLMIRRSQPETHIMEAKRCILQWVCSKIEREHGGLLEEEKEAEVEEEKKNLLMPENEQRGKKMKKGLALDFDLNQPAEVECLDL